MIASMLDRRGRVLRQTESILDAAEVEPTMSADRQPVRASLLLVYVRSGTDNSGTVTIAGTVDGSSDSEVLTFTAAGRKRTTKAFTAIDSGGITTSGLADEASPPTIDIVAVGRDGNPQAGNYEIAGDIAFGVTFERERRWSPEISGTVIQRGIRIQVDWSEAYTLRSGDIIEDAQTGERWLCEVPDLLPTPLQPEFWECNGRRVDNT